jgi:hypothetical protein
VCPFLAPEDIAALPDFPIWTGPTLEPRRVGTNAFPMVMQSLWDGLPNRQVFVERRRREVNAVAPVRFRV